MRTVHTTAYYLEGGTGGERYRGHEVKVTQRAETVYLEQVGAIVYLTKSQQKELLVLLARLSEES